MCDVISRSPYFVHFFRILYTKLPFCTQKWQIVHRKLHTKMTNFTQKWHFVQKNDKIIHKIATLYTKMTNCTQKIAHKNDILYTKVTKLHTKETKLYTDLTRLNTIMTFCTQISEIPKILDLCSKINLAHADRWGANQKMCYSIINHTHRD